jgi:hypothetical protein
MLSLDDYVVDVLMRDLVAHDRRPVSFFVYLWLTREQQQRAGGVEISYRELAESIGVSKSSAQSAVNWLVRRKLLSISKANATAIPRYNVQCPWRDRPGKKRKKKRALSEESNHAEPAAFAGTS